MKQWLIGIAAVALTGGTFGGAAFSANEPGGYLAPGAFDILPVLTPAPVKGDPRYAADRAIFKATRSLVGTPRYVLATNDVKLAPADMMRDFSCAAGVTLTPENAPRTVALVSHAAFDTARASGAAKTFYRRLRPFQIDRGAICQPASELAGSFDYPSGHTTLGWTWATLLAEMLPDRATPILARGRAFGESRIVCGVHNASAVEGGRTTAAAVLAALHGNAAFQHDLAAARTELDALRRSMPDAAPDAAQCAAEARLVAMPVVTAAH